VRTVRQVAGQRRRGPIVGCEGRDSGLQSKGNPLCLKLDRERTMERLGKDGWAALAFAARRYTSSGSDKTG